MVHDEEVCYSFYNYKRQYNRGSELDFLDFSCFYAKILDFLFYREQEVEFYFNKM